jgi:methionyl-tRNA formyltransferase
MRAVFLGTPRFAVPALEAMVAAGHEVVAVYTQPDRPKGRGRELAQSPVKECALRHGLPVLQPERIRRPEPVAQLAQLNAEVMVIVGYGQIIPQSILDLPPRGIINVHASLLPRYRGAAPIQWSIARGETVTGNTTMRIDAGLDTGDILLQSRLEIGPDETAPELSERLAADGARLLVETLDRLDRITPQPQDHSQATLAPILRKEDGRIDWTQPATAIHNRIRGFQPWPGGYTAFRGQALQIWRARPASDARGDLAPGALRIDKRRLLAGCGGVSELEILEVQLEGKKRIPVDAFLNGQRVTPADAFISGEARPS